MAVRSVVVLFVDSEADLNDPPSFVCFDLSFDFFLFDSPKLAIADVANVTNHFLWWEFRFTNGTFFGLSCEVGFAKTFLLCPLFIFDLLDTRFASPIVGLIRAAATNLFSASGARKPWLTIFTANLFAARTRFFRCQFLPWLTWHN